MGEIELISTTILPGDKPSAIPSGSNSTLLTSGVSGTMMITVSERSAISLKVLQTVAPASRTSAGSLRLPKANSSCPPLIKLRAMGCPMIPSPTKPIFMIPPPTIAAHCNSFAHLLKLGRRADGAVLASSWHLRGVIHAASAAGILLGVRCVAGAGPGLPIKGARRCGARLAPAADRQHSGQQEAARAHRRAAANGRRGLPRQTLCCGDRGVDPRDCQRS